jgi:DUF1680 family protein
MSNDGKAFTYVNQHASSDTDLSERHEWFDCACCPPNVTRTLAILGGYIWTFSANAETGSATVNVHLYTAAALQFEVGNSVAKIVQTTDWPWNLVTFECFLALSSVFRGENAQGISISHPPGLRSTTNFGFASR